MNESINPLSVKAFFEMNGFEVVDMRPKGGCLWVIGDQEKLSPYLETVTSIFNIKGRFAQGKATKYKAGWYTKCSE